MKSMHRHLMALAVVAAAAAAVVSALPATSAQEGVVKGAPGANSFWKGTPMDTVVHQLRAECSANNDAVACIKFRVLNVLDQVFRKDSFQVTDSVSVVRNTYVEPAASSAEESSARSESSGDLVETATRYLKHHDVLVQLPGGARVSLSPRALDEDQLDIKVDFSERSEGEVAEARHRRKGKLRKLMVPILVFILLKAMTLIPLAIGVLGLKAWNALQLSFFSFVISVALAIFQLCKKIAADSVPPPQLSTHVAPWDAHYAAARAFEVPAGAAAAVEGVAAAPAHFPVEGDAHNLAYRGH